MKKLLKSTVVMLALTAAAGAATWAYFTDSVTQPGNVFETGTLDIVVDGDVDDLLTGWTISNVAPGWTETVEGVLRNDGSLDAKVRPQLTNTGGDWGVLAPLVEYTLTLYDTDGTTVLKAQSGTINNFTGDWSTGYSYLSAGTDYYYKWDFELPTTVGDSAQGKSVTFDLVVEATQPSNPGWSQ